MKHILRSGYSRKLITALLPLLALLIAIFPIWAYWVAIPFYCLLDYFIQKPDISFPVRIQFYFRLLPIRGPPFSLV